MGLPKITLNDTYAEILMFSLPKGHETGMLYGCAENGRVAYVTRQDCANAAAGALINAARYENKALDITKFSPKKSLKNSGRCWGAAR